MNNAITPHVQLQLLTVPNPLVIIAQRHADMKISTGLSFATVIGQCALSTS